jgi:uncharacterized SAM-binding protein YcdF (DUF218 family)
MQIVRAFLITVVVLASITVILFLSLGVFLSPQDKLRKADAIVAISGGETQSRTAEAVKLYKEGYAPKLLFSGAASDPTGPSNAAAMRKIAIDSGVPASAIQIEESSKNTAENATSVAPILKREQAKSIILVTSPYHQRRASINFRRALGHEVAIINHSSPDHRWRRSHWWATDYSYHLTMSELQKTIYVLSTRQVSSDN